MNKREGSPASSWRMWGSEPGLGLEFKNSEWGAVQGQRLTAQWDDRLDLEAVIMKLHNTPEFAKKVLRASHSKSSLAGSVPCHRAQPWTR